MKVLVVVALAACGSVTTDSVDGPQIFAERCAPCHGPTGQPPANMVARFKVRDLTSAELRARVTPDLVEFQVRRGSENGLMPSFDKMLTDQQIKAVAAWVANPAFVKPR